VYRRLGGEKGGAERAEDYIFFYGKGNDNHQLGTVFFVHQRIVSAVTTAEFVSNRMSYTVLTGHWRMCMQRVRRKVMIQKTVFTGIRAGYPSLS
jgi:hypothetical protein